MATSAPSTPSQRCFVLLDELDAALDSPTSQRSLPYCVVLCLVSAFVWTWSISWVPPLLHNQASGGSSPALHPVAIKVSSLPSSAVVVDCGSGKAAAYRYSFNKEGAPYQEMKLKVALKLPELVVAAIDSPVALEPLWGLIDAAALQVESNTSKPAPIFFGATGGVRAALSDGSLSETYLKTFEHALRARYHNAAVHFEVLSGEREAQLELRATQYAFADAAALFGAEASEMGSLSGGGQTCQLAWGKSSTNGNFKAIVLEADLFGAQRVTNTVGLTAALAWWDEYLTQKIDEAGLAKAPGSRLKGPFGGIAMQATAAERIGLAGRVVTAENVVRGCRELLAHAEGDHSLESAWWEAYYFDEVARGSNPYGLDAPTFNLLTVLTVARLKTVVEAALEPTALLFFTRARDLRSDLPKSGASSAGQPTDVEWALGALLAYPWD